MNTIIGLLLLTPLVWLLIAQINRIISRTSNVEGARRFSFIIVLALWSIYFFLIGEK